MISATYLKISSRDQAKAGMWDVKAGQVGKSHSVIDDDGSSSTADTPYEKLRHQVSKLYRE